MPRSPLVAVALAGVAILMTACGGNGDDGGDRLSKADFIGKADPLCRDAVAAVRAIPEPSSQDEAIDAFDDLQGIIDGMLDDLRDLRPPAEDEDTLAEMYDKIDEMVTLSGELLRSESEEDFRRLDPQITQLEAEVAAIATEYGFESCGLEPE